MRKNSDLYSDIFEKQMNKYVIEKEEYASFQVILSPGTEWLTTDIWTSKIMLHKKRIRFARAVLKSIALFLLSGRKDRILLSVH